MTPTLKNLKYLIALKKNNHFSKAASECFVSPSTFSAGISKLEQDLQVQLVERDNKHVLFTPIGNRIVRQALRPQVSALLVHPLLVREYQNWSKIYKYN